MRKKAYKKYDENLDEEEELTEEEKILFQERIKNNQISISPGTLILARILFGRIPKK